MTEKQWNAFCIFRNKFKMKCAEWNMFSQELEQLQKKAAENDTPPYPLETPVVYSSDFERITQDDDIRLIVIGDNPGKNEQLAKNRRYLVGQSGKIADGFFRRNPELGIDFRKQVLILNKTPVHTAKTAHLRKLVRDGSPAVQNLIHDSQLWMARETAILHRELLETSASGDSPDLWLVGYTELKGKGVFIPYRDEIFTAYGNRGSEKPSAAFSQHVFVYQHFSMNRFLIDLAAYRKEHADLSLREAIYQLGAIHRDEIFSLSHT
jgi:hypothetical protein